MKTFVTSFWLLIFFISFSNCVKKNDSENTVAVSSLIFGKSVPLQEGNVEYYKLDKQSIFPDSIINFNKELIFSVQPLSKEKHAKALPLLEKFPGFLMSNPDKTFGCPNCSDQGTIYLETTYQGKVMKWVIDPINYPQELTDFIAEIDYTLQDL